MYFQNESMTKITFQATHVHITSLHTTNGLQHPQVNQQIRIVGSHENVYCTDRSGMARDPFSLASSHLAISHLKL